MASSLVSVFSTLLLCLIAWLEISTAPSLPSPALWLLLPPLLLLLLPLLQCTAYNLLVREGAEQRYVWGLVAAIVPIRFLDVERKRAGTFLIISQVHWKTPHLLL